MKRILGVLLLMGMMYLPSPLLSQCPGVSMADAARNGALSWGAGMILGMAKDQLFPGSAGATKADIDELKRKLDQISRQLDALSNQIAFGNHELQKEIRNAEFNIGSMNLQAYLRIVEKAFADLHAEIASHRLEMSKTELAQSKTSVNNILDTIARDIEPRVGALHKVLAGGQYGDGLYKIYADKLLVNKRFLNNDNYRKEVMDFVKYYNQIQAVETYLVLSLYKARGYSTIQFNRRVKELKENSKAEWKWLTIPKPVPENTVIFHARGLMFYMPPDYYTTMTMGYVDGSYWIRDHMNKLKILGYSDWRLPQKAEVDAVFDHWTGQPGTFAQHQGFEHMDVERYIGWGPVNPIRDIELAKSLPGHITSVYSWGTYNTTNGVSTGLGKGFRNRFQVIPVRTVSSAEMKQYTW